MQNNSDDENTFYEMQRIENKLNSDLGYLWWKKYIAGAFWSNISTPINLTITILTAIMSGQATTENLIPHNIYVNISITTLLLSTLNTFFKPHSQMSQNIDIMKTWYDYGNQFEKIYYSENTDLDDYKRRLEEYKKLYIEINKTKNAESPETQNFVTDLINYIVLNSCLKNKSNWLDMDKELIHKNKSTKTKTNINIKTVENKDIQTDIENSSVETNIAE
jgi:hypothetical protein